MALVPEAAIAEVVQEVPAVAEATVLVVVPEVLEVPADHLVDLQEVEEATEDTKIPINFIVKLNQGK